MAQDIAELTREYLSDDPQVVQTSQRCKLAAATAAVAERNPD